MSTVSTINTASDIQLDYMKLLVAQLQNQNPLEPMDNNQMASQLTQFSQLQQLEAMNSSFEEVLVNAERTYANSLIGKEVQFNIETQTGDVETTSGVVEQVLNNVEGEIVLSVGNYAVGIGEIISVKN
jgi:flagellar basal-body rod modification protein FlgD